MNALARFSNLTPPWLAAFASRHPRTAETYLELDPRSLGLTRLWLGCLSLADLARGFAVAADGGAGHGLQALVFFALAAVAHLLFLVGHRTRLFHFLSCLALFTVHGEPLQGAESLLMLRLLGAFTLFFPLGARFSLDALRARLAVSKEVRPEALADRDRFAPLRAPALSFAVAALLVLAPTLLGVGSGANGWVAVPLLLSLLNPWRWRTSRTLAVLVGVALHVPVPLMFGHGTFTPAAAGLFLLLLTDSDWQRLGRWFGPSAARRRVVYVDASCGVCFALSRLLARLDLFSRLTIRGNDEPGRPDDLTDELIERTIVVDDPSSGRRWIKTAAFGQIAAALPAGWPIAFLLWLPPVRWVADPLYDLFAQNRASVSVALGMAACGVPGSAPRAAESLPPEPRPLTRTFGGPVATVRELVALVLLVAVAVQGIRALLP